VASLDPKAALETMKLLKKINKDFNITIICNLHQTNLAMEFSDRVIGLSNGTIVFDQKAKYLDQNINKIYN
jgi:phosphonate transport system ATP-binding protein